MFHIVCLMFSIGLELIYVLEQIDFEVEFLNNYCLNLKLAL